MRVSALILVAGLALTLPLAAADFPSYDPDYPPPDGYQGPVFSLSQDYPSTPPATEVYPWKAIDFKVEPFLYLQTVLDYGRQGNEEVDWDVAKNPVRTWYHAPWMTAGCGGREFVRGMTRERTSRPGELHPNQTEWTDNWAVGFYNPPGGYVVGQVWADAQNPDASKADFADGTVGMKLLFTTGSAEVIPYLANSLAWKGDIYAPSGGNPCSKAVQDRPRTIGDLLLLQLDLAVRDDRSTETGWVFGTFIYNAAADGESPLDRMVPVGVSWGNDPTVTAEMNTAGAFVNTALEENVVNSDLIKEGTWPDNRVFVTHFGLGGRVNGPIDNPISSCVSCHGLAAAPSQSVVPGGATPANYTEAQFKRYFANVPEGPTQEDGFTRLDYSLQLAFGIRNFASCQQDPGNEGCGSMVEVARMAAVMEPGVAISREGQSLEAVSHDAPDEADQPAPAEPEMPEPPAGGRTWLFLLGLAVVALVLYLLRRKK